MHKTVNSELANISKQNQWLMAVFPLTLWLIGEGPNFLLTIVPKAPKKTFMCQNFTPIQYLSILNVIFPQICRIF